jgi:hypothetical protein
MMSVLGPLAIGGTPGADAWVAALVMTALALATGRLAVLRIRQDRLPFRFAETDTQEATRRTDELAASR